MKQSPVFDNKFLSGGGEMGELIRANNWADTPLGPVEQWPQSLKSALSICLNSNFPIAIYWGKDLVLLYNEAWSPIPGNKHPWALGKPAKEVWPEIWDAIEPQFQKAFKGIPGGSKDALLPMQRHGYVEECYFDFTFTPIYGEGGNVEGVFNAVIETTKNILSERQSRTLTELGKVLLHSRSHAEVIDDTIKTLSQNPHDFPFALFRSVENDRAVLTASTELGKAELLVPKIVDLNAETYIASSIKNAIASRKLQVFDELRENIGILPAGPWNVSPDKAIVIPIMQAGMKEPYGVLVVGLNPLRILDENYSGFFSLVADQMATGFTQVNVLEEERKKAEALAEIDRAKTAFFTNISHEFRTPITLMLGTIEEALHDPESSAKIRERMEVTHRSSMRLLKLVNTLLDFSRLEAGKIKPVYRLTDIAGTTKALAETFRSIIENAGLQYRIICDAVIQPVYIDREMWEKIVLNLLSNAFKYTLNGSVTVSLFTEENKVVLQVKDTGVGIPKEEMSRMFQRFHRVQQVKGRTFEGTGIGLSLVKELLQLHGGTIGVEENEGGGSVFTVSIPTGRKHLDPAEVYEGPDGMGDSVNDSFIGELSSLIESTPVENKFEDIKHASTVLVVDDNADMRNYISRLLQDEHNIITANNGMDALMKLAAFKIDLVITDVMMPIMDGIEFLKRSKLNPQTAAVPVILVSARAGEEAKVEGFDVGADDYLVKPFSGKELVARVRAQISISKKREKALQDMYRLFDEVPFGVVALKGPDLVIDYVNKYTLRIWQQNKEDVIGRPYFEARPDIKSSTEAIHAEVYSTGKRFEARALPVQITNNGITETIYIDVIIDPMRNDEGVIVGQIATGIDVTHYEEAQQKIKATQEQLTLTLENIRESEERFRTLAESLPQMIWMRRQDGTIEFGSKRWEEFSGIANISEAWKAMTHPDDWDHIMQQWQNAQSMDAGFRHEVRLKNKEGEYRWHSGTVEPLRNSAGSVIKWIGALTDIHDQKTFSEKLEKEVAERTRDLLNSESFLLQLIDSSVEYISVLNRDLRFIAVNRSYEEKANITREEIRGKHVFEITPQAKGTIQHESILKALSGETVHLDKRRGVSVPDIYVDTYFIPLIMEGKVEGVIIMARDVTNIVETENQLEAAVRELQRSNEDLQQFAHVVSHDLKEPVRKVRLFENRISEEFKDQLPEKVKLYLSKIAAAGVRMYDMIEGVLLYSSLNETDQPKEAVDLNEIFDKIETDLEIVIQQKYAVVAYRDLPVIQGHRILLYQLFHNLIANSLKFSKADVPLIIRINSELLSETEIAAAGLDRNKAYTKITVEDNGIGFDDHDASKIFQTFSRLNPKDKFEGTGLGLSLSKKIVERHGGMISAHGEEGKGAVFTIILPMA